MSRLARQSISRSTIASSLLFYFITSLYLFSLVTLLDLFNLHPSLHSYFFSSSSLQVVLVEAQTSPPVYTCDIDYHCGGYRSATAVEGTNIFNCICYCRDNFAGDYCERCNWGYTGDYCEDCLDGWVGTPCVDQCTNSTSTCSGHAIATNGLTGTPGNCVCHCLPNFDGTHCETCAVGYDDYPHCYEACTENQVSCNGHADYVYGTAPDCKCQCSIGYDGPNCDTCAQGFINNYPTCTDTCTNPATSCYGHAVSVVGPMPTCTCTCIRGYNGTRCDRCADGFIGYPDCYDNCKLPDVSCNGNGLSVEGNAFPNCLCTCKPTYEGSTCDRCIPSRSGYPRCRECAPGYSGAPNCVEDCTNVNVSCSGHATSVTRGQSGACACDCFPQYMPNTCVLCAQGYGLENGECIDQCLEQAVSCNGHADLVYKNYLTGKCVCECSRGYGGEKCDRCAEGYANYPTCYDNCTSAEVSCEGRGTAVVGDGNLPPACTCTCKKNYVGRLCTSCALGFWTNGYPSCLDDCSSVVTSCNNRAYYVQRAPTGTGCICNCTFGFGGEACERCALGFDGADCDRCASGFSGYPYCKDDCTNATSSCYGNALSVGGSSPNCVCRCKPGWAGDRCTFCDRGYYGTNCQSCSFGFAGYPYCLDQCISIGVSCNNRAQQVSGQDGNCTCVCNIGWAGQRCEKCATGYTSTYCDRCAPGYGGYPFCVDDCTVVAVSCGSTERATAVVRFGIGCKCTCKYNYAGDRCEVCAAGYKGFPDCYDGCTEPSVSCLRSATAVLGSYPYCICQCASPYGGRLCDGCKFGFAGENCDSCAPFFYEYPTCYDNCTDVNVSCAGHASNVSGATGNCACDCNQGYGGTRCNQCALGYGGYPNCTLACSDSRCSFRAKEVLGEYPNCTCICQKQFAGDQCERCAINYAGPNCESCAPGYREYPNCVDACTNISVSCNGHASEVSGAFPYCHCKCLKGFAGDTCGGCDMGYELYPFCTDACTHVEVSCNASRSLGVSGTPPYCQCDCKPGTGGDRCNGCVYGYIGEDCDQCAVGFMEYGSSYPTCTDNCTSTYISCNDRSFSVSGSFGFCTCDCINRFTGPRCDSCARGFQGPTCTECAPGFIDYPVCQETCTHPSTSCSGNADAVSGSFPDCVCTCKVGFTGAKCEMCAAGYMGPKCNFCQTGYGGYPECRPDCTSIAVSCNNRAYSVSGTLGNCMCDCEPQWALPNCATCFRSYTGTDCDRCATGYTGYPDCKDACTDPYESCNGLGLAVTGENTLCRCTCPLGYTGNRCEFCATGFTGYPNCYEDCTSPTVSCFGRASNVNGTTPNCNCNCTQAFTGYRCMNCSKAYNGTQCDRCAVGYSGYPNCQDNCDNVEVSCGGHGIHVTQGSAPGKCLCVCYKNFAGDTCDRCALGYESFPNCTDACTHPEVSCNGVGTAVNRTNETCMCTCPPQYTGRTCEACTPGFYDFPTCYDNCSDVRVSCNNNAINVSGVYPTCHCSCFRQFTGSNCSTCSVGFANYPTCYDDCTNALASCNGHASTVNQSAQGCICNCFRGFAGQLCDRCDVGFANYPLCHEDCTAVNVSCSDRAVVVTGSYPNCQCDCFYGYGGNRCEHCAPGFTGPDCDVCAIGYGSLQKLCDVCLSGYDGYPYCLDACTSPTVSCNGNAMSVFKNLTKGLTTGNNCSCTCYRGFEGDRCERCAKGFKGYPSCTETCLDIDASCNALAINISNATAPDCACSCFDHVIGDRCEQCEDGFGPWPRCVENCTSVNASCNAHASNVSMISQTGMCNCTCTPRYTGRRCEQCSFGYVAYPACLDACISPAISCNSKAAFVTGLPGNCTCQCFEQFSGSSCSTCATGYTNYPRCHEDCTQVHVSCFDHAYSVTGAYPNCVCNCYPEYTGLRCDRCSNGYDSYPYCFDVCLLTSVSCHSRATTVILNLTHNDTSSLTEAPQCLCNCLRGYAGDRCERCEEGYSGYPACVESCSSSLISCNDHALNVSGVFPNCLCTCASQFSGKYCDRCAAGYEGYPNCVDDCTEPSVSCGGSERGIRILSKDPICVCECTERYNGTRCGICSSGYDGFPACYNGCSNTTVSCNSHAASVNISENSTTIPPTCDCKCFHNFAGDQCQTCNHGFKGYPLCYDACIDTTISCHSHADAVSGEQGICTCSCLKGFAGARCDRCAFGYYNYPNCTEDCNSTTVSCNSHAHNVSGPPPNCTCNCARGYNGTRCSSCDEGFVQYPFCFDGCINVNVSCHGHAMSVGGEIDECTCNCFQNFNGTTCDICSDGYENYPNCTDACSNTSVSCNSKASSVIKLSDLETGGDEAQQCLCDCHESFSGYRCEKCAYGYTHYPFCYDDCSDVNVSCNSHAKNVSVLEEASGVASSHPTPPSCNCSCQRGFAGLRCDRCAPGYYHYPYCYEDCTDLNITCSGHATRVFVSDYVPADPSQVLPTTTVLPSENSTENSTQNNNNGTLFSTIAPDSTAVTDDLNITLKPVCTCSCDIGYNGTRCDRCAKGFSGFPTCQDDCTELSVSCNNHARSLGGVSGGCICDCFNNFEGATCDRCAEGYQDYPNCTLTPTDSPPPPMHMKLLTQPALPATLFRTGYPIPDRVIEISFEYDELDVALANQHPSGPLWHVFHCMPVSSPDEIESFGVEDRHPYFWPVNSLVTFNETYVKFALVPDKYFDIADDTELHVGMLKNCTRRKLTPSNSAVISISAEKISMAQRTTSAVLLGVSSMSGFLSANPAALHDTQLLVLLGMMGCARKESRGIAEAGGWLLSPFGFWGGRTAAFLGVIIPFLVIPLLHYTAMMFVSRKSQQEVQELLEHGTDARAAHLRRKEARRKRKEQEAAEKEEEENADPKDRKRNKEEKSAAFIADDEVRARFRFPGLSLLCLKLLLTGLCFHSVELIRNFTPISILAGLAGGLVATIFISVTIVWSFIYQDKIRFVRYPAEAIPSIPILSIFIPATHASPKVQQKKMFGFVSDYREVRFAAFDNFIIYATAVGAAFQPNTPTVCVIQYACFAVWFAGIAVSIGVIRPYRTTFLNITSCVIYLLFCTICVCAAAENNQPYSFAQTIIFVANIGVLGLSFLRAVLSLIVMLYEHRKLITWAKGKAERAMEKRIQRRKERARLRQSLNERDDDLFFSSSSSDSSSSDTNSTSSGDGVTGTTSSIFGKSASSSKKKKSKKRGKGGRKRRSSSSEDDSDDASDSDDSITLSLSRHTFHEGTAATTTKNTSSTFSKEPLPATTYAPPPMMMDQEQDEQQGGESQFGGRRTVLQLPTLDTRTPFSYQHLMTQSPPSPPVNPLAAQRQNTNNFQQQGWRGGENSLQEPLNPDSVWGSTEPTQAERRRQDEMRSFFVGGM